MVHGAHRAVLDFECGFVDLGTPTIDQLFRLCYSFHCWLNLHREHVVVLHGTPVGAHTRPPHGV